MKYYRASKGKGWWLSLLWPMPFLGALWWSSLHLRLGPAGVLCFGLAFLAKPLELLLSLIRGYTVTPDHLVVHRLFWSTRISLADFRDARAQPGAMNKAWGLLDKNSPLAYTGFYRSGGVGLFQAFVTDRDQTVVIRTALRIYVLSPEDPEGFVQNLTALCR